MGKKIYDFQTISTIFSDSNLKLSGSDHLVLQGENKLGNNIIIQMYYHPLKSSKIVDESKLHFLYTQPLSQFNEEFQYHDGSLVETPLLQLEVMTFLNRHFQQTKETGCFDLQLHQARFKISGKSTSVEIRANGVKREVSYRTRYDKAIFVEKGIPTWDFFSKVGDCDE